MPFTPNEIKNKTFTNARNGFEPTEVESYLEQLSNEIERLKEDKVQLEKVIEDKESNIQSYKEVHQSVSDALIHAKQAGEETKAAATKDAEATVSKAKAEADRIVNDAVEKARRLSFQTEDMKRQSKIFRSRFRMLVEAQLDLLKNEDWDYLLNYDLDSEQVTEENINHLNDNELTEEEKAMKARAEADNHASASDQTSAADSENK
ncbi:DivIVA domain-containing protein [Staphylococcus pseudoxylosus]|uniref:DivIVA domain-containing protein n=1 Tax=Staphylococcus pseudoxylosus TaxID=2282419 RepID=A0AAQ0MGC9_9STAP|nr:DivIVA domain-containing protein [Staphylococcus pseudoxylosus]RQM85697.1 cell division protein DivIVA [Staphylococcus xylosus]MBM2658809.1 DivIVA domain-containing protein [Staphylococcus pseudoxylosus]MCE5003262.1 DivIVA domain-containing protein [Staphylococcus pseudoxylosus]MDW8546502.1 DivIVA domain-containing protein [Staphylococcus pseudoxylosus]MEB5783210.1 DivIVA domain-containing protein [Staphylococcus pseudoxylosus]